MKTIVATLLLPIFLVTAEWPYESYPGLGEEPFYRQLRHVGNYHSWHQQQQQSQQQSFLDHVTSQADWVCRNPKTGDMMIITSEDIVGQQGAGSHWQQYPQNQYLPQYPYPPQYQQPPYQQPPQYQQPPPYQQPPVQQPPVGGNYWQNHNNNPWTDPSHGQQVPGTGNQTPQPDGTNQNTNNPPQNNNYADQNSLTKQTDSSGDVGSTTEENSTRSHGGEGLIDVRFGE